MHMLLDAVQLVLEFEGKNIHVEVSNGLDPSLLCCMCYPIRDIGINRG